MLTYLLQSNLQELVTVENIFQELDPLKHWLFIEIQNQERQTFPLDANYISYISLLENSHPSPVIGTSIIEEVTKLKQIVG